MYDISNRIEVLGQPQTVVLDRWPRQALISEWLRNGPAIGDPSLISLAAEGRRSVAVNRHAAGLENQILTARRFLRRAFDPPDRRERLPLLSGRQDCLCHGYCC
jgi:hypothetical protein